MINKIQQNGRPFVPNIQRGEVYWASVTPGQAVGSEQNHPTPSPWVIVSSNGLHSKLPIVVAVPLTSNLSKPPFRKARVQVPGSMLQPPASQVTTTPLTNDTLALTEQLRVLSHDRLVDGPVAQLVPQALAALEAGIKDVLDIP